MPCYDGREDEDNRRNYKLCAVLCGLITKNGIGLIDNLDWKEIGVEKSVVLDWWKLHQEEDQRRRGWEKKQQAEKKVVSNTLKKLSAEEINAIFKKRK